MAIHKFCIVIDLEIDDELMEMDSIADMKNDVRNRVEEILAADVDYIEMREGTLEDVYEI